MPAEERSEPEDAPRVVCKRDWRAAGDAASATAAAQGVHVAGYQPRCPRGPGAHADDRRKLRVGAAVLLTAVAAALPLSAQADINPYGPINITTGTPTKGIAIGDLNSDGVADIVATAPTGLVTLVGRGDGSFADPVTYPTGSGTAYDLALGDINGDGRLDVVVAQTNGNAYTLMGRGDGTFSQAVCVAPCDGSFGDGLGGGVYSIALRDVNGDGNVDLLYGGTKLHVLLGRGDGSFVAAPGPPAGSTIKTFAVGDFNGDGRLDVLAADGSATPLSLMLGNGDGSFAAATPVVGGHAATAVAVGDLNGDGNLDVVAANHGDGTLSLLMGKGNGQFKNGGTLSVGSGSGPFGGNASVRTGDVNGDGHADIIEADAVDGTVTVFLGHGDGTFDPPIVLHAPSGSRTYGVALGDINSDGAVDIVASDFVGGANAMTAWLDNRVPPAVAAAGAVALGATTATVSGAVTTFGRPATWHVEYSVGVSYSLRTANASLGPRDSPLVTAVLTDLAPTHVYHYRIVATTAVGTTVSADATFTTLGVVRPVYRCVVPSLVRLKLRDAAGRILRAHCRIGRVTRVKVTSRRLVGRVLRQSVPAGWERPAGAAIDLAIGVRHHH